jgi:hypothetical protein
MGEAGWRRRMMRKKRSWRSWTEFVCAVLDGSAGGVGLEFGEKRGDGGGGIRWWEERRSGQDGMHLWERTCEAGKVVVVFVGTQIEWPFQTGWELLRTEPRVLIVVGRVSPTFNGTNVNK